HILYRANAHFAVVAHNGDLKTALQLVHCFLRNNHRAFFDIGDEPHLPELSRPQNVSRIWKCHFVTDRTRFYVEATIERIKFTLLRIHLASAEEQLEVEWFDVALAFVGITMAGG